MERRTIIVRGIVQGVGFRPFVYELAVRWGLRGFVRNEGGVVRIEAEGIASALDGFLRDLTARPPPLARIDDYEFQPCTPLGDQQFCIEHSVATNAVESSIAPDAATCDACLAELFDPDDRRYRYPFLNCAHCGPRLTIICGTPYDRERTTMARFPLCAECRREYEDPFNRRFHAQATACPNCGPRLELRTAEGHLVETQDPLRLFARALKSGGIGTLKGIGGFHLVCDAGNGAAVQELRRRKQRDEQPFAVMFANIDAVRRGCQVNDEEARLLQSLQAPIVLLRKRDSEHPVCDAVAPDSSCWGVMLPYSPLHHLLMCELDGMPVVMTSGNRSSEPMAFENSEALKRLGGIADLFLMHDRPIHVRCDDSVTRVVGGAELPLRRSRGSAPATVLLPEDCPVPLLAVGGQLKGTFALASGRAAVISHHLGDLDEFGAYCAFERDVTRWQSLFGIVPEAIAHDMHPDYATTRWAHRQAVESGVPLFAVQHHHAHLASCLVENGVDEPAIGVVFDGTGFGIDEDTGEPAVWGGEFLVGNCRSVRRAAHLRSVRMPGGDAAAREPWRMAVAQMLDAGCDLSALARRIPAATLAAAARMIERRFNAPRTSSAGRLFDAVASIAGVCDRVSYEGQAPVRWECLAGAAADDGAYGFGFEDPGDKDETDPEVLDTRPLIRDVCDDVARGTPTAVVARRFHSTIVNLVRDTCLRIRTRTGIGVVALSGGVFANALLVPEVMDTLVARGFRVLRHRRVPPGDAGLCLGQAAIAGAALRDGGVPVNSNIQKSAAAMPLAAAAVSPAVHAL
jgi:hydrogenase maturation protein HypF